MELQELYHKIGLQTEAAERLKQVQKQIDLCGIDSRLEQLLDRETAAGAYRQLKECFAHDTGQFCMLYCQLEAARRIWGKYQEKQIPENIYVYTMKCFPRFLEECKKKNGRMFFDRGWWTYRQTSMSLFRIGALEYELSKYEGERAVAVHIPSDADFSKEAVDSSLEQAHSFFETYFGEYADGRYTCHSWLLSPALKPLLPASSHILSFQARFAVVREDPKDREFIEWLFQVPADTKYQDLPAVTGLQKKVRQLLLDGGTVGAAYGLCI
ncbi:MAG: acyltransferase domain-containing protein [Eubacterium sp.]|nr:acyltransferase domain-containing protein [Eubacterium sp.]